MAGKEDYYYIVESVGSTTPDDKTPPVDDRCYFKTYQKAHKYCEFFRNNCKGLEYRIVETNICDESKLRFGYPAE